MAKGKKTGGKDFQKGHTLSVGHGRPPTKITPEERQQLKNMSEDIQRSLIQTTYELFNTKGLTLQEIRNNKEENALKGILASVMMKTYNKGDIKSIDMILNRVVGPVKHRVDITTKDESINGTKDEAVAKMKTELLDVMQAEKEWDSQTSSVQPLPPSEVSSP